MPTDWANEPAPGGLGAPGLPVAPRPMHVVNEDWSAQAPASSDWAAETTAAPPKPAADQWGGSSNWN